MLDAFIYIKVTKSHVLVVNSPIHIDIPKGLKVFSDYDTPEAIIHDDPTEKARSYEENIYVTNDPKVDQVPDNNENVEILLSYIFTGQIWDRNEKKNSKTYFHIQ